MDDADQEARMLLGPLKDQAAPASTLDATGLRDAGQRRLRVRRWVGTSGIGAATAIALVSAGLVMANRPVDREAAQVAASIETSTAAAPEPRPPDFPVSCTARMLPVPAGATDSFVDGGDPTGRYLVGGYHDARGNRHPLLWDGGTLVALEPPGQENDSIVVNENGVVAGSSSTVAEGKVDHYNWVYRNGRFDLIGEAGHGAVEFRQVIDINGRGDILLDSRTRVAPVPAPHEGPAVWSGGRLRELTEPAGRKEVTASAIDDDGTVIGRHLLEESFAGERGLLWTPDGRVVETEAPGGYGPAGALREIRNGWVIGSFKAPDKPDHQPVSLVGNLGKGRFAPAGVTLASGVNRHGWVAGFHREAQSRSVPAIAGDGKQLLLPMPSGGKVGPELRAVSISDDGRTVGGDVSVGGEKHAATIWACQP